MHVRYQKVLRTATQIPKVLEYIKVKVFVFREVQYFSAAKYLSWHAMSNTTASVKLNLHWNSHLTNSCSTSRTKCRYTSNSSGNSCKPYVSGYMSGIRTIARFFSLLVHVAERCGSETLFKAFVFILHLARSWKTCRKGCTESWTPYHGWLECCDCMVNILHFTNLVSLVCQIWQNICVREQGSCPGLL